jgi:hypothetical protein
MCYCGNDESLGFCYSGVCKDARAALEKMTAPAHPTPSEDLEVVRRAIEQFRDEAAASRFGTRWMDDVYVVARLNKILAEALATRPSPPVKGAPAPAVGLDAGRILREVIQSHRHNATGRHWQQLSPGQQEGWRKLAEQVIPRLVAPAEGAPAKKEGDTRD